MSRVTPGYLRETRTGMGFRGYYIFIISYIYILYTIYYIILHYIMIQRGDPSLPVRSKTKTRRGGHIPPRRVEMGMTQRGGGISSSLC